MCGIEKAPLIGNQYNEQAERDTGVSEINAQVAVKIGENVDEIRRGLKRESLEGNGLRS
jgi:hypothetical protein